MAVEPPNLSPAAFAGTAEDYARYRPPYPPALIDSLLTFVRGRDRVLDLACGPGRVALALAPVFGEVYAVDSELEVVAVGRRIAAERAVTNVSWYSCRAEEFQAPEASFDLITIGEAFHRLDQGAVRALAMHWLKPGGVLATMGCGAILQGKRGWQLAVRELAAAWTRTAFPSGWASAREGALTDIRALTDAFEADGFIDVTNLTFDEPTAWTVDGVAGYLRSTSICSPSILGAQRAQFETSLRATLLELNPAGVFPEILEFGLTVARRPEGVD